MRVACRALDGLCLSAGQVFSFWRHIGPPVSWRGFARGRMLQQGCLVPVVGGGLCQLSNALYDVALRAGCEIVERHAHSRIVPGSTAAEGRDATVAWNYVDLRFAAPHDLKLTARLDRGELIVGLAGRTGIAAKVVGRRAPLGAGNEGLIARGCGACGETACFRHEGRRTQLVGRSAFLVDEAWPEFTAHVAQAKSDGDLLARLFNSSTGRYAWPAEGFGVAADANLETALRSLVLRRAANGAQRRAAELDGARRIAGRLARSLTYDMARLTVAQSYLPFLWRQGMLGGREVTVLMTRPPMAVLQARLDEAAARRPDRATLSDFRAPAWLVEAETAALAEAVRIVTPHADVAALFPGRAELLAWRSPRGAATRRGPIGRIAFPGPTAARKGACAVREAALALGLELIPLGRDLEGGDFWQGVRIAPDADWRNADAVVQPALVEEQPRLLLAALAAGLPVIASPACGLPPQAGLTLVPADDPRALIEAISILSAPCPRSAQ
ncbi:VanW family protein [Phenylobacterium montanum]|uniref:VanW family protein n=1 Tax=Phenylobacterium montanum TaxID=2823693 RepID=A0A975IUH4_9CAUL|nr:VanW family protein [Caulobacter sp. S6]QUD86251.1 VanW family protein [Caulobacter sp. S6]